MNNDDDDSQWMINVFERNAHYSNKQKTEKKQKR